MMKRITIAFDECSEIEGTEMYPNVNMLNLLSEAQTALEAIFFSLKREHLTLESEKEKRAKQETEYNERVETLGNQLVR